jgi:hypothetical protein
MLGEEKADFQTFWHAFHKEYASIKMPKIARDYFTELELCRVEMVGGEKFPGAKINLNAYLNAQAKKGIDNKAPPFNPLAANLWLKQLNGEAYLRIVRMLSMLFSPLFLLILII